MARAEADRIELTDPRALRAMAHPTRMKLVGLLRLEGPMTATEAAEQVGESPSSCSFHLRQLAKWGLVEEAGGGTGRQRPWRATAMFTNWQQAPIRGEGADARIALDRVLVQRYLDQISDWFDRRTAESSDWLSHSGLGDWTLYVTLEELKRLEDQVDALVDPYVRRASERGLRPEGARRVTFIHGLLPEGPAPKEPA